MTLLILAIALGLRLILLNQSLWLDEAIEALALMGKQGPLLKYAIADFQPPLYHFLLYGWTRIAGFSEVALRTPSLLAGVLAVYFIMKIAAELGGKKLGTIAGLLAATNPLLIYYSQEGRTYMLTAALVTASFYYFLKCLKSPLRRNVVLYLIWTILFLWTSYLAWFVLVAQGVYVLYKRRFDLVALEALSAATLLLWLPYLIRSLGIGTSTLQQSPAWGAVVGGLSWKSLPLTWVKFAIGRISFTNKYVYTAVVATVAALHGYALLRVKPEKYAWLLWWIGLPLVLGLGMATVLPVYQYFRVLFVLPAYLILLALGLHQVSRKYTVLVIAGNCLFLAMFWFTPAFHREDWRSLTKYLNTTNGVVAMPSRNQDAPLLYYNLSRPLFEPKDQTVPSAPHVYYLNYVEDLFDPGHVGRANIAAAGYTQVGEKTYPGLDMLIYEHSN